MLLRCVQAGRKAGLDCLREKHRTEALLRQAVISPLEVALTAGFDRVNDR
jgi:hypothetical protein